MSCSSSIGLEVRRALNELPLGGRVVLSFTQRDGKKIAHLRIAFKNEIEAEMPDNLLEIVGEIRRAYDRLVGGIRGQLDPKQEFTAVWPGNPT